MDLARLTRRLTSVAAVSLVLAATLALPAVASASLQSRIDAALARRGMGGAGTSVAVYDLTAKQYVYELRPDVLRLPASNEKLVTATAALAAWSPSYRFRTQLLVDAPGPDADGVVQGSVYLRGLGDPTLSTTSFQQRFFGLSTADVHAFVTALGDLGVTRITGAIVADAGYFDEAHAVPNWRSGMTDYCGPLSALTLNEGYGPDGRARDPALFAASVLRRQLRAAGIRGAHAGVRGVAPATATLVHTERSAELGRVLAVMDKQSDNFLAEELLKGLGADLAGRGTTAAGARVAEDYLRSIGVGDGFRVRDGSGLSYQDRLTTHAVVQILGAAQRRSDFPVFWRTLSVAGVDGTLADRMRGTAAAGNVHGKTGTLDDASSLSGYVTSADRHLLSFSILINGSPVNVGRAHAAQDAIAVLLAKATF